MRTPNRGHPSRSGTRSSGISRPRPSWPASSRTDGERASSPSSQGCGTTSVSSHDWQAFLAEAGSEAPVLGEDTAETGAEPRRRRRGPDHSTAGALHSLRRFGEIGLPTAFPGLALRFAVAAHHAGLDDRQGLKTRLDNPEKTARYEKVIAQVPPEILDPGGEPVLPPFLRARAMTEEEKAQLMRRFETFV